MPSLQQNEYHSSDKTFGHFFLWLEFFPLGEFLHSKLLAATGPKLERFQTLTLRPALACLFATYVSPVGQFLAAFKISSVLSILNPRAFFCKIAISLSFFLFTLLDNLNLYHFYFVTQLSFPHGESSIFYHPEFIFLAKIRCLSA